MKTALWILAAFALLAAVIAVQRHRIRTLREDRDTLDTHLESLYRSTERYRTADSLHAAGTQQMSVRLSEYRKWRRQDAELIESLRIKLRRLESASRHTTGSNYQLTTTVRDTIYLRDGRADTARTFAYHSPWIDLRGELKRDSVEVVLASRDTLVQAVHRIPRRFLFLRYGTKAIRQEIVSRNPHTEITYTEHITLRK